MEENHEKSQKQGTERRTEITLEEHNWKFFAITHNGFKTAKEFSLKKK